MEKVELTQYLHPHGKRRTMIVQLPDGIAELAKDQVLSTEKMPYDDSQVVLYSHKKGIDINEHPECEEILFADNGPGEKSPDKVLIKLIELVAEKHGGKNGRKH